MARGLFSVLTGLGDSASDGNGLGGGLAIYYSAELEEQTMSRAFERGLPLLVSNPDILRPDGKRASFSVETFNSPSRGALPHQL